MAEHVSETMERLHRARDTAWGRLQPAFDHAIALAREAEFQAAHASTEIQASIHPAYPPMVKLLADSVPPVPDLDPWEARDA